MLQYLHDRHGKTVAVCLVKEPYTKQAEHRNGSEYHAHEDIDGLGDYIEEDRQEPEPDMTVDMRHHIEDDRCRGFLCAYLGR